MMIHSYPIRVAIIGLGKMGTRHLQVLQKMPHLAELCAVFDIDKKKVARIEKDILLKTGVKIGVKSYEELLDCYLDVVIIATPIETHAMLAMEALGKDISVLVEKPMADSIRDAEIMLDMACGRTILMVGYTERFNGAIRALKEDIEDEPLIAIATRRSGSYSGRQSKSIVSTLVTHDIDLVHFLTGAEFKSITAETDGKLFFNANYKLTNGVIGNIQADKLSPFKKRAITIWGESTYWEVDLIAQGIKRFSYNWGPGGYTVQDFNCGYTEPLAEELKAFLCSVATGAMPPISGEDGLRAIRVAERCLGGET